MEKINIADLLRNCPQGMELDCTMYDRVTFDEVTTVIGFDDKKRVKIILSTHYSDGTKDEIILTEYGTYTYDETAKCVIFPKGKTTWEGIVPHCQFKDGDVLTYMYYNKPTIYIYRKNGCCNTSYYVGYSFTNEQFYKDKTGGLSGNRTDLRLATEEEKQKLFQAIKDNGYMWDNETKTLVKLIEPYFKVGDKIRHKKNNTIIKTISHIYSDGYALYDGHLLYFKEQDQYELVSDKFDITTLKPFESRVLVRDANCYEWEADIFGRYSDGYIDLGGGKWKQCIPYEGNEHLLGTTNDCDNYFKTWEDEKDDNSIQCD